MGGWLKSIVSNILGSGETSSASAPATTVIEPVATPKPAQAPPKERKIVRAPVLQDEATTPDDGMLHAKAQPARDGKSCTIYVSKPILAGYSAWYPDAASAPGSPLAEKLFRVEHVKSVLIHNSTLTITRTMPATVKQWEAMAKELGEILKTHLEAGKSIVAAGYLDSLPTEEQVRTQLQKVLDEEINPGVAGHGGVITLNRVEGNTVYITMGGGCQGCSAASITLRDGIFQAFRTAVPMLGAILDETDHTAGKNPFFTEPIPGA